MLIDTTRTRLLLERGQSTRLTDARQAHLASASGTLWVTIDNDPRDIVLEAGEGFDVKSSEPLLVCTLSNSTPRSRLSYTRLFVSVLSLWKLCEWIPV